MLTGGSLLHLVISAASKFVFPALVAALNDPVPCVLTGFAFRKALGHLALDPFSGGHFLLPHDAPARACAYWSENPSIAAQAGHQMMDLRVCLSLCQRPVLARVRVLRGETILAAVSTGAFLARLPLLGQYGDAGGLWRHFPSQQLAHVAVYPIGPDVGLFLQGAPILPSLLRVRCDPAENGPMARHPGIGAGGPEAFPMDGDPLA
jgi:hypothetical protein